MILKEFSFTLGAKSVSSVRKALDFKDLKNCSFAWEHKE
jgi:hypothetical protein